MNQLQRVQVYLDPEKVSILDDIANGIKTGRSIIIRDAVAAAVNKYMQTLAFLKKPKKPEVGLWMELSGLEKSKSGDLGLRVDEIYHERS